VLRRLIIGSLVPFLASCGGSRRNFTYETSAAPPTKIERLLLWLPAGDYILDGKAQESAFADALAPYNVGVRSGRTRPLELERSKDQRPLIAVFNPTHRLEIDIVEASSISRGRFSATSAVVRGVLYERDSRTRLAMFYYALADKHAPELAGLVVERLRATGYL
jgi:hypothetical protein